jgi:hypothetical protein
VRLPGPLGVFAISRSNPRRDRDPQQARCLPPELFGRSETKLDPGS